MNREKPVIDKKGNGYFTVEAAMVMPIVLMVQIALLYLMFFQYNRCLMEQDMAVLSVRAGTFAEDDDWTLEEYLRQEALRLYQEKYIVWEVGSSTLSLRRNVINISQKGWQIIPFADKNKGWEANASYEVDRISPLEVVRNTKKLTGEK